MSEAYLRIIRWTIKVGWNKENKYLVMEYKLSDLDPNRIFKKSEPTKYHILTS